MTNTPKEKTPREIAEEIAKKLQVGFNGGSGLHREFIEEVTAALAAERQKRDSEHCKDCCCARAWKALGVTGFTGKSIPEHIASLTAENERLTIKATNWELLAAGFEEWALHLRDEINEALSFGPTYKPELKGWVNQFVEWQKRMRESIWIKKPEALGSPTAQFLKDKKAHEDWSAKQDGKFKGDSAGPEKDIIERLRHYEGYDEVIGLYPKERKAILDALDRARGEGKHDNDGLTATDLIGGES